VAIAHDATSGSAALIATATTTTWTHTPVGTPKGVVVLIPQGLSTDQVSGVTYGGVALTRIRFAARSAAEACAVYTYFLGQNIPTGPQTVAVTTTGTNPMWPQAATLTADSAITAVDVENGLDAGIIANPSLALSPTAEATLYYVNASGLNAPVSTPESGTTQLAARDLGTISGHIGTKEVAGAGATTIGWTSASDDVCHAGLAVKESEPVAGPGMRSRVFHPGRGPVEPLVRFRTSPRSSVVGPEGPTVRAVGALDIHTIAANSYVLATPTGTLGGDVLLASITLDANAAFVAGQEFGSGDSGVPSGWTKIHNFSTVTTTSCSVHVFKRTAGGTAGQPTTDPSTFTWTVAQSVNGSGAILAVADADPTLDGTTSGEVSGGSSVSGDLTTTAQHDLVVSFAGLNNGTTVVYNSGPAGSVQQWGWTTNPCGQRNACAAIFDVAPGTVTRTWTASSPNDQGMWAGALKPAEVGGTEAPAEAATGAGAADAASVDITATADQAAGSGAAADAQGGVAGQAEAASATGAANTTSVDSTATPTAATGIGAAADGQAALTVNAEAATGTGAALDATVSTETATQAPAEAATGTGVAHDPGVALTATAEVATGTGAAQDAVAALSAAPGAATGTGAAADPSTALTVNAGVATGTGAALDATVSTETLVNAPADVATGTGAANDPGTALTVPGGVATATGTANNAVAQIGAEAPAGVATGSGAALDATVAITTPAGVAVGSGAALDATVFVPPPVPPPRWAEGAAALAGLVEGAVAAGAGGDVYLDVVEDDYDLHGGPVEGGPVEGALVGAGIVEGSSSL
jgi:hypothetical protein